MFFMKHRISQILLYLMCLKAPYLKIQSFHSGKSSSLQTIFSVQASGKPNYLCTRVPVPTHWDLDLLDSLLEDYEDKLVVEFLRYGWSMSRSILPLTNGSAKVNHKGALEFPDAINHYLATDYSNNTLLGLSLTTLFLIEQLPPHLILCPRKTQMSIG